MWDLELLNGAQYDESFDMQMITSLIEHPVQIKPAVPQPEIASMPLFLTAREKKKIVRMRKKEKQDAITDRIRLGLQQPPEPRVKLSNLMRVLGNSAIQDPSAVEKKVRAQVEKRKIKHTLHNAERKLTPQERKLKKRAKLKEDTSNETQVALFRVTDLSNRKHRFKIDVNAQQYNLTGCCIINPKCNLILIEGGPTGIRKYTRLMLHRIKWVVKKSIKFFWST
eukprot:TRINITY_DN187_c0_g1_i1.p1 TRINITY_DN187_c0_g1~~TRINITY_DN187_c0_g1_i1.p1  ORF type:complete len:224 (-),score=59.84 TRINITY_DN187_c0_g1_i1:404-1075(-)